MEKTKVFFTDLHTRPGKNLLDKFEALIKKAGISTIDLDKKLTVIKIHFGEPGNHDSCIGKHLDNQLHLKPIKSYENTTLKKLSHNFLSYGTASIGFGLRRTDRLRNPGIRTDQG